MLALARCWGQHSVVFGLLQSFNKLSERHAKRPRESQHVPKRDIALTDFDAADVRAIDVRVIGEIRLAPTSGVPKCPDAPTKDLGFWWRRWGGLPPRWHMEIVKDSMHIRR